MDRPTMTLWRPATTYYIIGGLVLLLVAMVVSYIVTTFQPTVAVQVGGGFYRLWLADNEPERVKGLSGVKQLGPSEGLLMKFDSDDNWGIWMKDMKIPIDIVWLDANKRVVHIVKNAQPDLSTDVIFKPKALARYVIELPAGSAEASSIVKGSLAQFDENNTGGLWW